MARSAAITQPLELIALFFFSHDFDYTVALDADVLAPEVVTHI